MVKKQGPTKQQIALAKFGDDCEAAGLKPMVRYRANVVERRGDAAVLIGGSSLVGDGDGAFYTFVYVNLGGRPYLTAINVTAVM